jgi:hypothetical protein
VYTLLVEIDLGHLDGLLAVLLGDGAGDLALLGFLADGLVVLLAALVVEVVDLFLVRVLGLALDDGRALRLAFDLQVALGAGDRAGDRDFLGLLFGPNAQRQGEYEDSDPSDESNRFDFHT